MKRVILTFVVFILMLGNALAQSDDGTTTESFDENYESPLFEEIPHTTVEPEGLPSTKQYSTENVKLKKFDNAKWRKVAGDTDYDNVRSKPSKKTNDEENGEGSNSGARKEFDEDELAEEEPQSTPNTFPSLGLSSFTVQIIFYTLIAIIIGAIIFMIVKNASWKSNPKVKKLNTETTDHSNVEDITTLDIDDLLKRSQAAGNYRLALRINFLGLLKKLNEIGFILWKKDKTNREYLNELLSKQRFFEEVRILTLAYEQVWYGDHELPVEHYEKLMVEFKALDVKLNMSRVS